jgi:hypothetical protein
VRSKQEIREAEDEFSTRVWYMRKRVMLQNIQDGTEIMPPEAIMDGMTRGMRDAEEKYPDVAEDLSDFEWGMVNGKLSALRWMFGDEWDSLDT